MWRSEMLLYNLYRGLLMTKWTQSSEIDNPLYMSSAKKVQINSVVDKQTRLIPTKLLFHASACKLKSNYILSPFQFMKTYKEIPNGEGTDNLLSLAQNETSFLTFAGKMLATFKKISTVEAKDAIKVFYTYAKVLSEEESANETSDRREKDSANEKMVIMKKSIDIARQQLEKPISSNIQEMLDTYESCDKFADCLRYPMGYLISPSPVTKEQFSSLYPGFQTQITELIKENTNSFEIPFQIFIYNRLGGGYSDIELQIYSKGKVYREISKHEINTVEDISKNVLHDLCENVSKSFAFHEGLFAEVHTFELDSRPCKNFFFLH